MPTHQTMEQRIQQQHQHIIELWVLIKQMIEQIGTVMDLDDEFTTEQEIFLVVGASFSIALYKYNSNVKDLLFYYIY